LKEGGKGTKPFSTPKKRLDFDYRAFSFRKIVTGQLPRQLSGVGVLLFAFFQPQA